MMTGYPCLKVDEKYRILVVILEQQTNSDGEHYETTQWFRITDLQNILRAQKALDKLKNIKKGAADEH